MSDHRVTLRSGGLLLFWLIRWRCSCGAYGTLSQVEFPQSTIQPLVPICPMARRGDFTMAGDDYTEV